MVTGASFAISVVAHKNRARCAFAAITLAPGRHSEFELALTIDLTITYLEGERGATPESPVEQPNESGFPSATRLVVNINIRNKVYFIVTEIYLSIISFSSQNYFIL